MGRHTVFLLFFFIFPLLAQHCAGAAVNASGGLITPLDMSFIQPLGQWALFYGDYSTSSSRTQTLSVGDPEATGNYSIYVSLVPTSLNYWVSESENPTLANLTSADLAAFDAHYGLDSHNSAAKIFNDTANFTLSQPYGGNGSYWVDGPAAYYRGRDSNGTASDRAYVQGLFENAGSFVFLVPLSNSSLENGTKYDFVFILPYPGNASNATQRYYLLSTLSPPQDATPPSEEAVPPVPYHWTYDEEGLHVFTVPHAFVQLKNAESRSAYDNADSTGAVRFVLKPGKYSLTITASGYSQVDTYIMLNEIAAPIIRLPDAVNANDTKKPEATVSIGKNASLLCVGGDCYVRESKDVLPLAELQCTGQLCKYVGDDVTEFIRKYDFKPQKGTLTSKAATPPAPSPLVDIYGLFSGIGAQLSSTFGGGANPQQPGVPGASGGENAAAAVFVIVVVSAAAYAVVIKAQKKPPSVGHD